MSLRTQEINALSVLNSRKLNFLPAHFNTILIHKNIDIKNLDRWINFNLNSRYAIKFAYLLNNEKKISYSIIIGFEDSKELTMFSLSCPYL